MRQPLKAGVSNPGQIFADTTALQIALALRAEVSDLEQAFKINATAVTAAKNVRAQVST
ncbi:MULTISPECIES: hypothetical protein [unclassified Undibacterium]|uniref:hypothetical protein n=1 Tax=unclassified Undibacterium TaxID=2630295 RepID=UPI002AC9DFB6|nr:MULTISPECIES: hypothetical protein [unclassified Undibacterium]MEB0140580.1 hypothetical protein [Undibacterium sp. CCC2.1]MEB0173634.1 hypothetical protein [Undibacterium sp. CCC1.1]MEB0177346.1 hypothetical protein [Undibacterium sp. CCC3.4]MEB0216757.1 hypothetical protein [Undibacterium sp. 5I2]WPX44563.1 hypothetical protein RHM61_04860 [Undibacterium sp. CCC3.4]